MSGRHSDNPREYFPRHCACATCLQNAHGLTSFGPQHVVETAVSR